MELSESDWSEIIISVSKIPFEKEEKVDPIVEEKVEGNEVNIENINTNIETIASINENIVTNMETTKKKRTKKKRQSEMIKEIEESEVKIEEEGEIKEQIESNIEKNRNGKKKKVKEETIQSNINVEQKEEEKVEDGESKIEPIASNNENDPYEMETKEKKRTKKKKRHSEMIKEIEESEVNIEENGEIKEQKESNIEKNRNGKKRKIKEETQNITQNNNNIEPKDEEKIDNDNQENKKKKKSEKIELPEEKDKKKKNIKKDKEDDTSKLKKKENDDDNSKIKKNEKDDKPTKGTDPKSQVLDYLISQNRPYSVINIFDNLHGNIKKKQLENILDTLVKEKNILCKEYQSKCYLACQHHYPEVDKDVLKQLEDEIDSTKETILKSREKNQQFNNELKIIITQLSDEELERQNQIYKSDCDKLKANLKAWEEGAIQKIPDDAVNLADKEYDRMKNLYKKIKKVCLAILDFFSEGMEMKRDEFILLISGFENDTDAFSLLLNKQI